MKKTELNPYVPKEQVYVPSERTLRSYIGRKGYTIYLENYSSEEIKKIKEDLTFKPFHIEGYGNESEPFVVYGISNKKMFLPKFYGLKKFGLPYEIKLNHKSINVEFKGKLRDNQKIPINISLKEANKNGGGIISLSCGGGKTVMALYLISKLAVKTIVVVNKEFLLNQWKERIKQFLPDARIGILRQKKIQVEDKDIVLAMLQSIAMCKYDSAIFSDFGMSIYDEVHCVPSRVFSKALRKIQTKYHFGLSATPNRADGMTKALKLFIGDIIYKTNPSSNKNPKNVKVFSIKFKKIPKTQYYKQLYNYRGKPDIVKMLGNVIKCPIRLNLLTFLIQYFIRNDKRHILVLSDRIQYLRDIENRLYKNYSIRDELDFEIGYFIGGMKEKERKKSEKCDLILASYSMAKEAMDIEILDTLLMATSKPGTSIEQPVGRIQRKEVYPLERPPLIIDFVDNFCSFKSQASKRESFYQKKKYPVYYFSFENDFKNLEENLTMKLDEIRNQEYDLNPFTNFEIDIDDYHNNKEENKFITEFMNNRI